MDYEKIFNELQRDASCYKGYKMDYWDGVEDCAFKIIDALVCSTIMRTGDAREAKRYIQLLRDGL